MREKNLLFSVVGAGLEYYDFLIYGLLAVYLSRLFFPQDEPTIALIQTLAILTVGYLTRPLGGLILGAMSDRFGRKKIFLVSMLITGCSTFLIGCLPTYATLGVWAPILLTLLRMIQGLAFGAEIPGVITFLMEHAHKNFRGTHTGLVTASLSSMTLFGSLEVYLLSVWLNDAEILAFGWRIPFLLGGILALLNFLLRRHITETPFFLTEQKHTSWQGLFVDLLRHHPKMIGKGLGITLLGASLITFALTLPSFFYTFMDLPHRETYAANAWGLTWAMIIAIPLGYLSDRVGRRLMLAVTALCFAAIAHWLFQLPKHNFFMLLGFMVIYQTVIVAMKVCYATLLGEVFPTRIRSTGFSLIYNLAFCIGSAVPASMTYLAKHFGIDSVSIFFIGLALLAFLTVLNFPKTHKRKLGLGELH